MKSSATLKGRMELAVGAAVARRGQSSASEIYQEILRVGDRAYLANVYVTAERLVEKNILRRRCERRVTADGVERDVRLYDLSETGRLRLAAAIDDLRRDVDLLQLTR